jgi:hypothetical protein
VKRDEQKTSREISNIVACLARKGIVLTVVVFGASEDVSSGGGDEEEVGSGVGVELGLTLEAVGWEFPCVPDGSTFSLT